MPPWLKAFFRGRPNSAFAVEDTGYRRTYEVSAQAKAIRQVCQSEASLDMFHHVCPLEVEGGGPKKTEIA